MNDLYKVECVIPVVVSSEFRFRQHRDDDYQEDAPHFGNDTLKRSTASSV